MCNCQNCFVISQKHCRHAFCRDCAKKAAGVCPKCKEAGQIFEEAAMGNVFICTHGGGRSVSLKVLSSNNNIDDHNNNNNSYRLHAEVQVSMRFTLLRAQV